MNEQKRNNSEKITASKNNKVHETAQVNRNEQQEVEMTNRTNDVEQMVS